MTAPMIVLPDLPTLPPAGAPSLSTVNPSVNTVKNQVDALHSFNDTFVATNPTGNQVDTTTGQISNFYLTPYSGPVLGLAYQFIDISKDGLNLAASTPNVFLHSGSGQDAIQVASGNNVLDGGTGSNFLVGGTGSDTFFVDDRSAPADIWSTMVNFHAGDSATIWGVSQTDFALNWADNLGAAGFTGLTLTATASGKANAAMTLAGFSQADLTNGKLTISFGTDAGSGSIYMNIRCN